LDHYAWYIDNAHSHTWPVGSLRPNALGVFDMYGNVWEWCQDHVKQKGQSAGGECETVNAGWGKGDPGRVLQGSSFTYRSEDVRSHHSGSGPDGYGFDTGFRPVRTYR
jgi:sulfatase modifying factor 1